MAGPRSFATSLAASAVRCVSGGKPLGVAVSLMHGQPFIVDREEFQSWPAKAQCATAALLHVAGLDINDMRELVVGRQHIYAWVYDTDEKGRKYVWGRHGHDVAYRLEEVAL